MALSTLCWYSFEVTRPLRVSTVWMDFQMLYSKNCKQNSKIMFRMNITAKSAAVIQIVSVLHFIKSPTTWEPNPLKEVGGAVNCVWDAVVCDALSEVLVVEVVRGLSRWDAVCLALWQAHRNYCNKKKKNWKGQENRCNSYHWLLPSL